MKDGIEKARMALIANRAFIMFYLDDAGKVEGAENGSQEKKTRLANLIFTSSVLKYLMVQGGMFQEQLEKLEAEEGKIITPGGPH
jgi:hypothetical protein